MMVPSRDGDVAREPRPAPSPGPAPRAAELRTPAGGARLEEAGKVAVFFVPPGPLPPSQTPGYLRATPT